MGHWESVRGKNGMYRVYMYLSGKIYWVLITGFENPKVEPDLDFKILNPAF